jgi:hypothetical protein
MTLYAPVQWFYAVMVSVVFGASVYEALVVHPAWSRKPSNPSRIRGHAGQSDGFAEVLGARGAAVRTEWTRHAGARAFGPKPGGAIIVSAVCAVAVVAWTLLYFRPTIRAVSY